MVSYYKAKIGRKRNRQIKFPAICKSIHKYYSSAFYMKISVNGPLIGNLQINTG